MVITRAESCSGVHQAYNWVTYFPPSRRWSFCRVTNCWIESLTRSIDAPSKAFCVQDGRLMHSDTQSWSAPWVIRLGKPGEGIESASTFHLNASTIEIDTSHFRLDLCHCNSIPQLWAIDAIFSLLMHTLCSDPKRNDYKTFWRFHLNIWGHIYPVLNWWASRGHLHCYSIYLQISH